MGRSSGIGGRSGIALAETLVAVMLLELAAAGLVAALLTVRGLDRGARLRASADLLRRDTVALQSASATCRGASAATAVTVLLPAMPGRPPLATTVRCGR